MSNHRIISADTLLQTVLRRKSDYQRIRENTLKISTNEKQIKAPYYALKYLYPKAKFPPVYFVIGRFNTGGTITPQSQIIGAEMSEPNNIPCIVAHELIHANQNIPYKYKILLEQCIIEGSADFLGELISGKIASTAAYEYAKGKEKELWDDFVKDIDLGENDSFSNWLYGGERKDNRPADMGYYIGYMITKAYYDKAADKSKAIEDILNITDCKEFLKKSGYNGNDLTKSTIETSQDIAREVTFICTGCKENNKFVISGTENFMFRNLKFPLKQKLKIGDYTMTYFQNRVQQIALPFKVEDKTDNTVIVK